MDTLPIHSIESENIVLSAIMGIDGALGDVAPYLQGEPFYDEMNAKIYDAIRKIESKGQPVDIVNVMQFFATDDDFDGIRSRIMDEIEPMYTREYVFYAQKLQEMEMKRAIWNYSKVMEKRAVKDDEDVGEIISDCSSKMDSILQMAPTDQTLRFDEVLRKFIITVNENTNGTRTSGYLTGFDIIDRTGGLHPADLMIIAAESSQGKTALAMNVLLGTAKKGTPCAVYSMEMTSLQLAARFVAMEAQMQNSDLLYKKQSRDDLERIDLAVGTLERLPIYFDDRSTSNIDTIIASIRRMVIRYDIKVAAVDYIQMLTLTSARRNQTDEQILGSIARRLKNLAKELEICIIAISQLSRDYANPVPSMNRLRASGQIGEAADVVMLLYRPEAVSNGRVNKYPEPDSRVDPKGTALISIAKGRNTGLDKCFMEFRAQSLTFTHFGVEGIPLLEGNAKEGPKEEPSEIDSFKAEEDKPF